MSSTVEQAYELARESYAALGTDTEAALERLSRIAISLHCWQGDDVRGFEDPDRGLSGGILATGSYPGKARTPDELRADLDVAYRMIPGSHRLNLHAMYLDTDVKVPRDQIEPKHYAGWLDWARERGHGLDFNPTCFSHELSEDGFTLSHHDPAIRDFWVAHCIASREVGAYFGRELGTPAVTNLWIPDGMKDTPIDRAGPRARLAESLDRVFAREIDPAYNLDAVESKLFGIGSESYVVGSHEFYMGYAITRGTLLTLDSGHFHRTESIADKISAVMPYVPGLLLHVSRGVRWDSDHVVILNDELQAIMQEVVRGGYLDRTHVGLDFFDASINRVMAWVIGARNTLKALLIALLEPAQAMRLLEYAGDYTSRLTWLEEVKTLPFGAVWDMYCARHDVPLGMAYKDEVSRYSRAVLSQR
ncbi:MAG: L-rhamnose isomerase [Chloroflexota bacterium]